MNSMNSMNSMNTLPVPKVKATRTRKLSMRNKQILELLDSPKSTAEIMAVQDGNYDITCEALRYLVRKNLCKVDHIGPRRVRYWIAVEPETILEQLKETIEVRRPRFLLPAINLSGIHTTWRFPHGTNIPASVSLSN